MQLCSTRFDGQGYGEGQVIQKLIYEGGNGRIELGPGAPFILSRLDLGEVDTVKATGKSGGQHGVNLRSQTMGVRLVRASCAILCSDEEALFTMRRFLGKCLCPGQTGTLFYHNGYQSYKIGACVDASVTYTNWIGNRRGQYFNVDFYCPDPFFREIEEIRREFLTVTPKFRFPLCLRSGFIMSSLAGGDLTLYNRGDAICPVRIEITGPAQNPVISNLTTNEHMGFEYYLEAGETITITTHFANKKIAIVDKEGNEKNGLSYIDVASTFFSLAMGENRIKFRTEEGFDYARAKIYYNPGYLIV